MPLVFFLALLVFRSRFVAQSRIKRVGAVIDRPTVALRQFIHSSIDRAYNPATGSLDTKRLLALKNILQSKLHDSGVESALDLPESSAV